MLDITEVFDQELENKFLRAAMHYSQLLPLVRGKLEANDFSTKAKAGLFKVLDGYNLEHNSVPNLDDIEHLLKASIKGELASVVVTNFNIIKMLAVPEWVYFVSRMEVVVGSLQLRKAIFSCSENLKKQNYKSAVESLVSTIRRLGMGSEQLYSDLDRSLQTGDLVSLLEDEESFCFPTRIYCLDDVIGGIHRKQLFLIMAYLNVGKSWMMVHLAFSALLSGKSVLYFTLEMSKKQVMLRLFQNVSGAFAPRDKDEITRIVSLWELVEDRMVKGKEEEVRSVTDAALVDKHWKILRNFGGKLSVKEYFSSTASVGSLESDIQQFEVLHGSPPDVVFVDGLTDLVEGSSSRGDNQRQRELDRIVKGLRRIASEYNLAVVSTHQGNRKSGQEKLVESYHSAESVGIMQIADTAVSLAQTKSELNEKLIRLYVMRTRNTGGKGKQFRLFQNLELGQFCQGSQDYVEEEDVSEKDDKFNFKSRAEV